MRLDVSGRIPPPVADVGLLSAHGEPLPAFTSVYCSVTSLNFQRATEATGVLSMLAYGGDSFSEATRSRSRLVYEDDMFARRLANEPASALESTQFVYPCEQGEPSRLQ